MFSPLINRLSNFKTQFKTDSLFRNAIYLVSSTSVMSALGFFFWVFVAHLYVPAQIGEASALISVSTLLSTLSLLGLNSGLMRFLPQSKDQSKDINAAMIIVASVTILATVFYVLVGNKLGGNLALLSSSWHKFAFVILMTTVSLNTLTDAVFIANRKAQYHTVCYSSFGLVKLVLPLFLIPLGSLGIYLAYIAAVIVSLAASYYFMWRRCGYHFKAAPNWHLIRETKKYTSHNYVGDVLGGLPSQLLPLLIIRRLGAADVAYFAMAWMMANLLYIVPSATTQSLIAESSTQPGDQAIHIKRTISLLVKVLVPTISLSILIAPYLLNVFGARYQQHATVIFQLLAASTIFVAINYVSTTVLNLEKRTGGIIAAQSVNLIVTFIATALLIPYGLTGIGLAMSAGYAATSLTHFYLYRRQRHNKKHSKANAFQAATMVSTKLFAD
jgi:O-antigen/teichoic acid export membrane protein